MVPKGEDEPVTRVILGNRQNDPNRAAPPFRPCPKCNGRADLLEQMSLFATVNYYRCEQCLEMSMHEKGADSSAGNAAAEDDRAS